MPGYSCLDKNGALWIDDFFYKNLDGQKVSLNSLTKITKQHAYVYNLEDSSPNLKVSTALLKLLLMRKIVAGFYWFAVSLHEWILSIKSLQILTHLITKAM